MMVKVNIQKLYNKNSDNYTPI